MRFTFYKLLQRLHLTKRIFISAAVVLVGLKLLFATLTPSGFDFIYSLTLMLNAPNAFPWSVWIIWVQGAYQFWSWLPVEHGDALRGITDPSSPYLLPSYYLLSLVVKVPLIAADVVVAFLIRRICYSMRQSETLARRAVLLWLANPFVTLLVEMWGSMDIIVVALSLAGVLAVLTRVKLSAFAVAAGIALKLSPLVTWLAMLAWLIRRKPSRWNMIAMAFAGPLGILAYFCWITQGGILTSSAIDLLKNSNLMLTYSPVTQTYSEYSIPYGEVYIFGLATMLVTFLFMAAASIWPKEEGDLIPLILSGFLLLYGLANWFPPAFIWAMPFIALWNTEHMKSKYPIAFYLSLALFFAVFYSTELTSPGQTFLFIPMNIVPWGRALIIALQSASHIRAEMNLGLTVRSVFAGVTVAFAGSVTWKALRRFAPK
jgi:hypothetical protein